MSKAKIEAVSDERHEEIDEENLPPRYHPLSTPGMASLDVLGGFLANQSPVFLKSAIHRRVNEPQGPANPHFFWKIPSRTSFIAL